MMIIITCRVSVIDYESFLIHGFMESTTYHPCLNITLIPKVWFVFKTLRPSKLWYRKNKWCQLPTTYVAASLSFQRWIESIFKIHLWSLKRYRHGRLFICPYGKCDCYDSRAGLSWQWRCCKGWWRVRRWTREGIRGWRGSVGVGDILEWLILTCFFWW